MHRVERPPLPGDLALYRYGRTISHGAIVTCWPQIIHAHLDSGCVVLDDGEANAELERRFVGFWSFWGDAA
jgi:cell wall-associated NlpC family hydrolase